MTVRLCAAPMSLGCDKAAARAVAPAGWGNTRRADDMLRTQCSGKRIVTQMRIHLTRVALQLRAAAMRRLTAAFQLRPRPGRTADAWCRSGSRGAPRGGLLVVAHLELRHKLLLRIRRHRFV